MRDIEEITSILPEFAEEAILIEELQLEPEEEQVDAELSIDVDTSLKDEPTKSHEKETKKWKTK